MQTALFLITLFILGACFGSFLCCQARRLHYRLKNTSSTKKSAKKSRSTTNLGSRSVCLSCHRQLKWYENIPIFSWLFLKGKCRSCGKKIGIAELLSEVGVATAFALIGTTINLEFTTPLDWLIFGFALLLILVLSFLAIYDGIYGELPVFALILTIIFATFLLLLKITSTLIITQFTPELIYKPLVSVLILGGLYLALYCISKGKWVGDGDWLLGLALGLALGEPWLALLVLFLSNTIACLVMFPVAKKQKQHQIHFGPFLVIAFVIVYTLSTPLISLI